MEEVLAAILANVDKASVLVERLVSAYAIILAADHTGWLGSVQRYVFEGLVFNGDVCTQALLELLLPLPDYLRQVETLRVRCFVS